MANCPVCNTKYSDGEVNYCSNCGWQIAPISIDVPEVILERDAKKIAWAKRIWLKNCQINQQKSEQELNLEQEIQEKLRLSSEVINLTEALKKAEVIIQELQYTSNNKRSNSSQLESLKLNNEREINYALLELLLMQKKWREANQETIRIILKITDRYQDGWVRIDDLTKLSKADLKKIDHLWVKYSNHQFGYSVQSALYSRLGGDKSYDYGTWEEFVCIVGWKNDKKWIWVPDPTWTNLPTANLPLPPPGYIMAGSSGAISLAHSLMAEFID